jgi:DNA-binding NarL/FixJ family response regulator
MPPKHPPTVSHTKIRILLVDDHPLVREALVQRIQHEPDMTVCAEASTAAEALEAIGKHKPDLAIVDISLPGRDGIDLIKEIHTQFPKVLVLVLSFHDESLYADRALRAGAKGYVTKHEPPENLLHAIREVLAGKISLNQDTVDRVLHRLAGDELPDWESPLHRLSDRELEIFRLIGQGLNRHTIATQLHLSVKTVEAHSSKIRLKLGLKNTAELIQNAFQFTSEGAEGSPHT